MTRISQFFSCMYCLIVLLGSGTTFAQKPLDPKLAKQTEGDATQWYDLQLLGIEGKGYRETKAPFDRLPAKAEGVVRPPVWGLSRHSAGMCARFVTDATTIKARWTLISPRLAMPHMPATGVSGLDLYVKTERGKWRWLAGGRPSKLTNTATLVGGIPKGRREYMLYLPLYNGVSSVELGIPAGKQLAIAPPRQGNAAKPIVFWGTSITQGGCASRPGMVHTAILGRRLNRPVINMGFSGNGKMEPEMASLLAELDASVFVIDCLPNMVAKEVSQRVEPLVRILRKTHLETPILLVEDRSYSDSFLLESKRQRNETNRAALKVAYQRMTKAGIKNLSYLTGEGQLGDDGEATVDSSHPTDLGFVRMADKFEASLRPLLKP